MRIKPSPKPCSSKEKPVTCINEYAFAPHCTSYQGWASAAAAEQGFPFCSCLRDGVSRTLKAPNDLARTSPSVKVVHPPLAKIQPR